MVHILLKCGPRASGIGKDMDNKLVQGQENTRTQNYEDKKLVAYLFERTLFGDKILDTKQHDGQEIS